jgi:hypothetical protein
LALITLKWCPVIAQNVLIATGVVLGIAKLRGLAVEVYGFMYGRNMP